MTHLRGYVGYSQGDVFKAKITFIPKIVQSLRFSHQDNVLDPNSILAISVVTRLV